MGQLYLRFLLHKVYVYTNKHTKYTETWQSNNWINIPGSWPGYQSAVGHGRAKSNAILLWDEALPHTLVASE